MILREPYRSKSLKLVNLSAVPGDVNRYIAIDYAYIKTKEDLAIKPFSDGAMTLNPVILYGLGDSEKAIVPLNHPVFSPQNHWAVLDLRNYYSVDKLSGKCEVRNTSEHGLAVSRFILSGMWFTGKQSRLYGLELAHFAFSSWLSDNLAAKFGLDLGDKLKLRILANIYYSRLFTDPDDRDSDELNMLLVRAKNDGIIPELFKEVYEEIGELETIEDFCVSCFEVTGNIRLKNLDYTVLVNVISTNWMGSNGRELSLLSLEHPPTWISLVSAAIRYKSFKKNHISTIVERVSKRGKDEVFTKQLQSLVNDYLEDTGQ